MRNLILALSICFIYHSDALSQDSTLTYSAELHAAASTANTPLWLNANQYGTIPVKGSFLLAKGGFHKVYNRNNPRIFQWSAGAELIANAGKNSALFFTDLYLAGKAGPVEISIGQRKEFSGLCDSTLTSGSIAMSTNARPYPKIQISTPDFLNIIPASDIISLKFSYSDGLLGPAQVQYGNVRQVPDIYLHQKWIYFRLGGRRQKLNLFAGFNHQAIWGGEDKIFSSGLKRPEAYRYVVFGKPWQFSRVGNHFGTIDLAMEWKFTNWTAFLYRQNIYEDGSLSNLSNIADGLNGFRLKRTGYQSGIFKLKTFLFEFLYTKNQGGSKFDFATGTFGQDNYFNHYVYQQGWSYRNRSLGTPLIAPKQLLRDKWNVSTSNYTLNNRIIAYHIGSSASINEINLTFKGSYSANYGTYASGFGHTIHQTSFLIRAESPLPSRKKDFVNVSLAADIGGLYPNNAAVMIGWKKSGFTK